MGLVVNQNLPEAKLNITVVQTFPLNGAESQMSTDFKPLYSNYKNWSDFTVMERIITENFCEVVVVHENPFTKKQILQEQILEKTFLERKQ